MSRFAQRGTVHFWEEPTFHVCEEAGLTISHTDQGVRILTPRLPEALANEATVVDAQRRLLDQYLLEYGVDQFTAWYYTPMALRLSDHLKPSAVVYDCMDELSAFQGAPPALIVEEQRLFRRADVVFAGGASLYACKRTQHKNVHLFPSSVDRHHFAVARTSPVDPVKQSAIPHPRIGFFGVLDERLDRTLLQDIAALHPEWHFVLLGPIVKIREDELPMATNLHYLGYASYSELPQYLGNWDVAMLPFALNASTRFISPTKTPEYLAGGRPVVSTPVRDVVTPYGELGFVRIAETAEEFALAIQQSLQSADPGWLERVDAFLAVNSWDKTFEGMWHELERCRPLPHQLPMATLELDASNGYV